MKNYKTTAIGVGTILVAIGAALTNWGQGGAEGVDWTMLVLAIVGALNGLGLVQAKDGDK